MRVSMIRCLCLGLLYWFLGSLSLIAQVSDDFTDGDFTSNPAWIGQTNQWQINAQNELQSNSDGSSDTLYLATAQSLVDDTEWRIRASYTAGGPSTTNRIRIYLMADSADLTAPLNGYFLQVGESGSADSYDLYRQTGTSISKIIDGVDPLAGSGVDATLKVNRDQQGNWTLAVDQGNQGVFSFQGTAMDDTHLSSTHMGIWVRLTSTRTQSFTFDEVYVGDPIVDQTPPSLSMVTVVNNQALDVLFSEPVEQTSAETPANYLVNNGFGIPSSVTLDPGNPRLVRLTFPNSFVNNTPYILSIQVVEDLNGNAIPSTVNGMFTYVEVAEGEFKQVLINEILADPTPPVGLPDAEYLELYNRSDAAIDLANWTLTNGTTVGTLPTYQLDPDAYVVLVRRQDTALFRNVSHVISPSSWTSLVNSGDNLGLRNANGVLIDTVDYDNDWYRDGDKDGGGFSLELINPNAIDCAPAGNWIASSSATGGTPGTQNSVFSTAPDRVPPTLLSTFVVSSDTVEVCFSEGMDPNTLTNPLAYTMDQGIGQPSAVELIDSDAQCVQLVFANDIEIGELYNLSVSQVADCQGNVIVGNPSIPVARGIEPQPFDIVITELFPDASPSVGLPEVEFIELYNRTDQVLDISALSISDGSSEVELGDQVMLPQTYYIICPIADTAVMNDFGPVIPVGFLPSLNNTTDSIRLFGRFFELIDYVFYTDEWYQDLARSDGGYTLERIDPNFVDCNNPANWRASQSNSGGTPGQPNSVLGTFSDTQVPILEEIEVISPTIIRLTFAEPMDASTLSMEENFLINQGVGEPNRAISGNADNRICRLDLASALSPNTLYEIAIRGLKDCAGNAFEATEIFGLPTPADPGDVIITELFPDPEPSRGLPQTEFIEIHNRSDKIISLKGWSIGDFDDPKVLEQGTLIPGAYLVIAPEDEATSFQPIGEVLGLASFPTLTNSTDSVYLRLPSGILSDYVMYDDSWYNNAVKADGGFTLERIDRNFLDCNNRGNWQGSSSPTGGTPGRPNTLDGVFEDRSRPDLLAIRPLSNNEVELVFDEQMDPVTLEAVDAYEGNNGLGNPVIAQTQFPAYQSVTLTFAANIDSQQIYQLTVTGLTDCAGNEFNRTISFGLPEPPDSADVLINEILFNPITGGKDYLEIVNVSEKVLDLSKMQIAEVLERPDTTAITEITTILLPGQILCLTEEVAQQEATYFPPAGASFLEVDDLPTFDDADGDVVLLFDSTLVLDRFSYLDDYHFPALDDKNGVALERLSLKQPTQDPENWQSAASTVGYGTPGYANSQFIVENPQEDEVYLEKQTFSPNGDGMDDVLAINYQFNFPAANARVRIINTRGTIVRQLHQNLLLDPQQGAFFWDGTQDNGAMLPIGMYIVVMEVQNEASGRLEIYRRVAVLADRL